MPAVTPGLILAVYAGVSLLSFLVYGVDKLAARRGWRRVAERHLHGLALLGGWPGGWLAQRVWRHKSGKSAFLRVFWMSVAVNCGVLLAGLAAWR